MQISNIQPSNTFRGFRYDKTCRYLVDRFVNPKAFPKVYQDLQSLGKRANISVKMSEIPISENISLPAIEYTIKPKLWRRLLGIKPYRNWIDVSNGFADRCANILPLELERAIIFQRLG